jgi:hypothetical protein
MSNTSNNMFQQNNSQQATWAGVSEPAEQSAHDRLKTLDMQSNPTKVQGMMEPAQNISVNLQTEVLENQQKNFDKGDITPQNFNTPPKEGMASINAKNRAAQNLEYATDIAEQMAKDRSEAKGQLSQNLEYVKETAANTKNQAAENLNYAKDQVLQTAESTKNQAADNLNYAKDKIVENAEWAKDRIVETAVSTKNQAAENINYAKDQIVETAVNTKNQAAENLNYAKDQAVENTEAAKEGLISNLIYAKDVILENAQWALGQLVGTTEGAKEGIADTVETVKNKASENWEYAKEHGTVDFNTTPSHKTELEQVAKQMHEKVLSDESYKKTDSQGLELQPNAVPQTLNTGVTRAEHGKDSLHSDTTSSHKTELEKVAKEMHEKVLSDESYKKTDSQGLELHQNAGDFNTTKDTTSSQKKELEHVAKEMHERILADEKY